LQQSSLDGRNRFSPETRETDRVLMRIVRRNRLKFPARN
jgi:hypothetical protein